MFLKCHLLHLHLAGFVSTERETQEQIDQLKRDVIQMIKSLGGDYVDTDVWDDSVTHVIAKLDPEKEGLPEKVMGAIAGGKLVLTKVKLKLLISKHSYFTFI